MINKGKPVWVILDQKGMSYDYEERIVGVFDDRELVDKIIEANKKAVEENKDKIVKCKECPFYNREIPEKIFKDIETVPACHIRNQVLRPNSGVSGFGGYDYSIYCRGNFEREDWLREYRVDEYELNKEE